MKRIVFLQLLLCVAALCRAELVPGLTVTMMDGSEQKIAFETKPVVTMAAGELLIKTESKEFSFDLQKVKTFVYGEVDPSGIDAVSADASLCFYIRHDVLYVGKSDENRVVSVTSDAGISVLTIEVMAGATGTVSLEGLVPGVYMVSVDGETLKYIKR